MQEDKESKVNKDVRGETTFRQARLSGSPSFGIALLYWGSTCVQLLELKFHGWGVENYHEGL